jgi:exopolysaccharide production protein ExoF
VNVTAIEHSPVYIIGPVKNPGAFKYTSGMTVLHALALAGGLKEREAETWQRVEFGREVERLQRTLDRAKRLIARTAVLQSERDGKSVPPDALSSLAGKAVSASLIGEESWQRNLTTMSRAAQEASLRSALNNAKSDLASRSDRLGPLDATIAMRAERVKGMTGLADRNVIGRPVLIQAQSDLGDAQDRRQQALLDLEAARKRVADGERDLERFRLENGLEVGKAASVAKREAADTLDEGQGLLDVVKALTSDKSPSEAHAGLTYEIVRKTATGASIVPATPTALLQPGDLIRLRQPDAGAPQPALVPVPEVSGSGEQLLVTPGRLPVDASARPAMPEGGTASAAVPATAARIDPAPAATGSVGKAPTEPARTGAGDGVAQAAPGRGSPVAANHPAPPPRPNRYVSVPADPSDARAVAANGPPRR